MAALPLPRRGAKNSVTWRPIRKVRPRQLPACPPARRSNSKSRGRKSPISSSALAVGDDEKINQGGVSSFEVWFDNLVIQRDLETRKTWQDPESVQDDSVPVPGRAHLQVFLDQNLGRCLVFSASGAATRGNQSGSRRSRRSTAEYGWENIAATSIPSERLRIARWTGDLPREIKADQPRRASRRRLHRPYGLISQFDAAAR